MNKFLIRQCKKIIIPTLFLLFASGCVVLEKSSSPNLVDWSSTEGMKRFNRSKYKVDFFYLSSQFQNQIDRISCGPTTGAIVLNALRINTKDSLPKTTFNEKYKQHLPKNFDPRIERYTPENFMNKKTQKIKSLDQLYGQPIKGVNDFGLQIKQLHQIFLIHKVKSKLRIVDKSLSNQNIKQELISNLSTTGDYVIVNYKRSILSQQGEGHISPLGAYDAHTDSFLIMDVNSSKYPWVWVKAESIIGAMRTFDTVENRGYLLITD